MGLICVSFSHQHTPIAFRERIHFDPDATANACARFRCGENKDCPFIELSVLSTCNRTEVYAFTSDKVAEFDVQVEAKKSELIRFISEARGIAIDELNERANWFFGPAVTEHLARVACGLESMVLGEPQILGQVGDAMRLGLVMNSSGPVLTKLFQTAITAGRRARTGTAIGLNSANIATLAVNTAERELGSLRNKVVVLLGAGDMADLALSQLRKKDVGQVHVVNRTIAKAKELARKYGGIAHVFEQLREVLLQADILITSTGAPHTLITKEMIELMMRLRGERALAILDIAVPRDVEIAVDEVANVSRCDIDDLQMVASEGVQSRESSVPQVEAIVEQEVDRFLEWFRGVGIEQTVISLRQKTEVSRENEFKRLLSLLPQVSDETLKVIEQFSHSLTNKLLHHPTSQLRKLEGTRSAVDHGEAIRELFDLLGEESKLRSESKPQD